MNHLKFGFIVSLGYSPAVIQAYTENNRLESG